MSETIRVIIVDDLVETRENVRKLLQFEQDIEVIGQAGTGEEAIALAKEMQPDVILMDINMPGVDGIGASQQISELVPRAQIIIMSVQSDSDYLRRAMLAGARDFLTKPFGGDQLVSAVRRVYEKRPTHVPATSQPAAGGQTAVADAASNTEANGKVLVAFSPKGGSGCSTIAINAAISLAKRNYRTVLVDGSLQFGDVAVMLNMKPVTSIVDVTSRDENLDNDLISSVVQVHNSGLHVLLAPARPEMADQVTEKHIQRLIATLTQMYDFIIIDTSSAINDISLSMMDAAHAIILVAEPTLPSLKNVSRYINLTESLDYQKRKIWLVVNSVSDKQSISVKNISDTLKRAVVATFPMDSAAVSAAANKGKPLVISAQKRPISVSLHKFGGQIEKEFGSDEMSTGDPQGKSAKSDSGSLFGRLLKR